MNFIIPLVVYPFDVMVSFEESDKKLFSTLLKYGIEEDELKNAKYAEGVGVGRFVLFSTGQSLIRLKNIPNTPSDYGYLMHEVFHVTTSIMWRMGMKFKIKISDESYAYLIQYISQEIFKKIF